MAERNRMPTTRRKEKKEREAAEASKDVKKDLKKLEGAPAEGVKSVENGEAPPAEVAASNGTVANGQDEDLQLEQMELPPFEINTGERIDPFLYKYQFKNVEYSSGRNKTILCYLIDSGSAFGGLLRGFLEDEHSGHHAEEAFFIQTLPDYNPAEKCTVTWYVSSSPCSACASKIVEVLKAKKSLKLSIFAARLFEWEEPEIQAGLRALHTAGCKLRVMKPLDFSYTWDTFVENEEEPLNLWEDCKDNYEYYQEKLADILQ